MFQIHLLTVPHVSRRRMLTWYISCY